MKSLWEQYGWIIITVIAMAMLISITFAMSKSTSSSIEKNVDKFEQVGDSAIDEMLTDNTEESTEG